MKRFLATATVLAAIISGRPAVADEVPRHGDPQDHVGNQRQDGPAEGQGWQSAQRYLRTYRPRYYRPNHGYQPAPLHHPPRPLPRPYPWPYYYEHHYYAPLYIPAEELYGPQATARFLGWNTFNRRPPVVNLIVPGENADRQQGAVQQNDAERDRNLRGTNPKAVALAWKFIGFGDAHFADQKYTDALGRYRKAVRAAPQLAEGYFRQGYALAAMGRYELAAKALKRGLALDPAWPASGFHNDELYGRDQVAKAAQLDAMAKAAERQPHNADLMFLLGVYFHFDGEPERAAVFFGRAAHLLGGDDAHLKAFMGN